MRGLNKCLSTFYVLLSGWDKIQCRCCPSNELTDFEFHETRHMIGRDLLWVYTVYMNIRLRMYQNQYDILYVKNTW